MALATGKSIITDGGKPKYNPNDYTPFGAQADMAVQQGWIKDRPATGGAIIYKNNYDPAFSGVMIDGKPTGHLEIVGNKNGLFNVHIADQNGNVKQVIMASQPYAQVDNYLRNGKSIIQQRMNRIQPQATATNIQVASK